MSQTTKPTSRCTIVSVSTKLATRVSSSIPLLWYLNPALSLDLLDIMLYSTAFSTSSCAVSAGVEPPIGVCSGGSGGIRNVEVW